MFTPPSHDPSRCPALIRAIPAAEQGAICLFDADGTLWVDDVADDFTQWMIAEGHISGARWLEYMHIYKDDAPAGCRFLLSLYTGMSQAALAAHVAAFWSQHAARRWVDEVIAAMHDLAAKGYTIWVVTGSPTDFMLPLLEILPVAEIVGMDFEFDEAGRITGRHAGISCAGQGKAEKVAVLADGAPIAFACGNGDLDGPMMSLADQAWAVYPNPKFAAYAQAQGWPILPRPADFIEEAKFLL
ncbi:HAD-IB family phosphatase [Myxococcota bacterium]|nr:HAD-IB family phosphatase [Myxococcota bacterium]MBU1429084.1 HAD-IB family phosphatase [Myxococcota bacterium]MBU1900077.1 HAD-IB family phosphatase [Myxococcota bacterium]